MRVPSLLLAIALCACAAEVREPPAPPSTAPIQASFDAAQIREHAATLADDLDIDRVQRSDLLARLDDLLADEDFKAESERDPVRAVGVYHWGQGGFVVKFGRGEGRIRMASSGLEQPFVIDLRGAGAMVGGSASWGIVLALGLDTAAALEGKYAGTEASATALDETAGAVRMKHRNRDHELWFIGVAEGLSANAGAESLRFSFGSPD
jgi:hypothetical protein